jgi:two-component system, chemotaxis family, CheB/CheR fusion protein
LDNNFFIASNQLFHNLISNAFKFADDKRLLEINISSRKLRENEIQQYPGLKLNRDYAEILFRDNGIGFEQQYAGQIFEIFQRLHEKSDYPGTGIGLALCKKIVSNHGGVIFGKSVVGKGTTFHIIMPVEAI